MERYQSLSLHVIVFISYGVSFVYNLLYVGRGKEPYIYLWTYKGYGGKFKYITFINLIIQSVYFGFSIINDIWGSNARPSSGQQRSAMQRWRDYLLASIVYPVGTFVVMTFWGIYMVDRELVYPKHLDEIIPPWLNHVMHTTVLPILLIEKYLVYHQYPSKKSGISGMLFFAMIYLLWILWVAYYADIWVYPVLQVLNAMQRVIFISLLFVFFISIYIVGESVNKFLWRKERQHLEAKPKPKKAKKIS